MLVSKNFKKSRGIDQSFIWCAYDALFSVIDAFTKCTCSSCQVKEKIEDNMGEAIFFFFYENESQAVLGDDSNTNAQ